MARQEFFFRNSNFLLYTPPARLYIQLVPSDAASVTGRRRGSYDGTFFARNSRHPVSSRNRVFFCRQRSKAVESTALQRKLRENRIDSSQGCCSSHRHRRSKMANGGPL